MCDSGKIKNSEINVVKTATEIMQEKQKTYLALKLRSRGQRVARIRIRVKEIA